MFFRFIILIALLATNTVKAIEKNPDLHKLEKITGCSFIGWIQRGERWTFQDWMEDKRSTIYPILDALKIFEEVQPSKDSYDYAIVLGSLHQSIEKRLGYLIKQWNLGVRYKRIIFLTGRRKLDPKKEPFEELNTETDLMVYLWGNMDKDPELGEVPLDIIDARALPFNSRPTTLNTVETWLDQNPITGTCIVFSNQPFVQYQHQVLTSLLGKRFDVNTVGPAGGENTKLSILLDSVAKTELTKQGYLLL